MAKSEPISSRLREAMWEADQKLEELFQLAAEGDKKALKKLVCLSNKKCDL